MQSSLKPRIPNRLRRSYWLVRSVLALLTIVSILHVSPVSSALAAAEGRALGGALSIRGTVNVNGQPATDGQTLFANSQVSTEKNSESLITFANGSRLNVFAQSDLTIESSETRVLVSLEAGRVLIDIPEGVALNFKTADLAINKQSTGAAVLQVESSECVGTRLEVFSGQLETQHHGHPEPINARETFSTMSATVTPQGTQNSSNGKSQLGIFFAIGGATAIILAVVLGPNDPPPEILDFGGSVGGNLSPR